jgi:hypothetical protein
VAPTTGRAADGELRRGLRQLFGDTAALASLIGYAGLGPMVAGLVIIFADGLGTVSRATALIVLIRYSAIALTFLAGIRWGMVLRLGGSRDEIATLVAALLPPILGWMATLAPPPIALGLLAASFAGLGAWDVWTADRGRIPDWYGVLRFRLTIAAVVILVAALLALMR